MNQGQFLEDVNRGERRFRVRELLFDGGDYQIALAEDVQMDDKLVCAKTIAYESDRTDDKKYVAMRRKALHEELGFLAQPIHLLPEPLDWIQLEESATVLGREPVLVYEYTHGETLYDLVRTRHPGGVAPTRALRIAREVCQFLVHLHRKKWVYRNLDPRHVIVGYDDVIHLVGFGNAMAIGEKPNPTRVSVDSAYIAPEVRKERSGKLLRPAADIYSLGALMSFMLTGEEPRMSVENPLTKRAYDRLNDVDPPGLALLVARAMQPMAKQRFGRAERMLPYTQMHNLPTPKTDGFGLLQLPAPWTGAERPDSRAARSKLSPGPLISVEGTPEEQAMQQRQETRPEEAERKKRDWEQVAIVLFFLAALVAAALALFL
jgi:serine/threonine protein kinase